MKISYKNKFLSRFCFSVMVMFTVFSVYFQNKVDCMETKFGDGKAYEVGIKEQKVCKSFIIDKNGKLTNYVGSEPIVVIPDTVKVIGRYAFSGHNEIKSIVFPTGLLKIENYAFSGCTGLTEIDIPDRVIHIADFAFASCTGLKRVILGTSVKKIGELCFAGCDSLEFIVVDEDNPYFSSEGGILYDKNYKSIISCPQRYEREIVIKSGVKKICKYAFYGCKKIPKISFNDDLEEIGEAAFFDCEYLSDIDLKEGLKFIERGAFLGCLRLNNVSIPATTEYIGDSAFFGCKSLKNIKILSSYVKLGNYVFKECPKDLVITAFPETPTVEYAKNKHITVNLL